MSAKPPPARTRSPALPPAPPPPPVPVPTPPPPPDRWAKIRVALDVLADLGRLALPDDGPDDLATLEVLWERLGIAPGTEDPAREASARWRARLAYNADHIGDVVLAAVRRIDQGVGDALDRNGSGTDRLIRTADFAQTRLIDSGRRRADGSPVLLACGLIDSLPHDHRLRTELPPEHLFLVDSLPTMPALILGPLQAVIAGPAPPRRWYSIDLALQLTRQFRSTQVAKAEEEATNRRREDEEARRRFHESELGKLRRRLKALEELEQAGKIPAEPPPAPPTIRGHGAAMR